MPKQSSNTFLIMFLLVVACALGGGLYYFLHQQSDTQTPINTEPSSEQPLVSPANPQPTVQPNNAIESRATASLDQSALTSNSATPTITGTFSEIFGHGLEIVIATSSIPGAAPLNTPIPNQVWSDRSDHGGGVVLSGDDTGTFKSKVQKSLPDGSYTVGVYAITIYYPQTPENLARNTRTLVAEETLVIQ